MPGRVELLQSLRLKGRATPADLAAALRAPGPEALRDEVARAVGAGLVVEAGPRLRLAPSGREELDRELAAERATLDAAAVDDVYRSFEELNGSFKQLVTDWQLVGGTTPNDHTDAGYDAAVVARLADLDRRLHPLLDRLVALVPRLAPYPDRFGAALDRVRAGDHGWLARPLIDSYHTVWFELHEELLGLTGRSRVAEAAAGRDA